MKLAQTQQFVRYFESVYFRRLFVSYVCVALLISSVCFVAVFARVERATTEEMAQYGNNRLSVFREQVENTYPGLFKQAFFSKLLSAVDSSERDPFYVFYEEYGQSTYQMYHLVRYLKDIAADHAETDHITFYFKNTDYMVDQYAYFPLGARTPGGEWVRLLKADDSLANRWILRDVDYGLGVQERLMTYAISFPEQAKGSDIQGYLLIDIRADRFHLVMDSYVADSREKLFMHDVPGGFIVGSSSTSAAQLSEVQEGWDGVASHKVRFLPRLTEGEQWVYAGIFPADIAAPASLALRSKLVLIGLAAVGLGMLLAYVLAVKSYQPLQQVMARWKERSADLYPKQQRNELQAIDAMMMELHHTIQYLSQKLSGNRLLDLLHGRMTEDEATGTVPAAAAYLVVKVTWDGDKTKEISALAVRKLTLPHLKVENRAGVWTILYYAEDGELLREQVRAELAALLHHVEGRPSFAAGIGSVAVSQTEIARSFEQAEAALAYTFVLGRNTMLDYGELSGRDEMPQLHYELLENALRAGDRFAVEQFLHQFAAEMAGQSVSLEAVQFCLMQLSMAVSKVILEVNRKENLFPVSMPMQLLQYDTWHESFEAIRALCLQVASHMELYMARRSQHELASTLTTYIQEHLHEDISLDQLAALTGLSTSYLSRQFREQIGVPFIDYVTNARLERACNLLRQSELSVKDIAANVGYSNSRYFCARFKGKFGVTPMQYRNMPLTESAFSKQ